MCFGKARGPNKKAIQGRQDHDITCIKPFNTNPHIYFAYYLMAKIYTLHSTLD